MRTCTVVVCAAFVAAGCGPAAETNSPPEKTLFQQQLAEFVLEAQKLKNLIEMGATKIEHIQQGQHLRRVLASLVPGSDEEQSLLTKARELERQLDRYSRGSETVKLILQRQERYGPEDDTNQRLANHDKNMLGQFLALRDKAASLLDQLREAT